jgi:hypothetical protein
MMVVPSQTVQFIRRDGGGKLKEEWVQKLGRDDISPEDILEHEVMKNLRARCGKDGVLDIDLTKTEERKVDFITNHFRDSKYLSAYDDKGTERHYPYYKGYPSVITREVRCQQPDPKNPVIRQPLSRLEQELENKQNQQAVAQTQGATRLNYVAGNADKNYVPVTPIPSSALSVPATGAGTSSLSGF